MSISTSDLALQYSVSATEGNSTAGTAVASLGDQLSTTAIPDNTLNNTFGTVSGSECTVGAVKYRCFFAVNNHATLTLTDCSIILSSQTALGSTITVAADNIAASAVASSSAQASSIAAETDTPSGTGAYGSTATLGDIAAGQCKAFWIKQTTQPGTDALTPDLATITLSGTSSS